MCIYVLKNIAYKFIYIEEIAISPYGGGLRLCSVVIIILRRKSRTM